jgi:hypothetical protein
MGFDGVCRQEYCGGCKKRNELSMRKLLGANDLIEDDSSIMQPGNFDLAAKH